MKVMAGKLMNAQRLLMQAGRSQQQLRVLCVACRSPRHDEPKCPNRAKTQLNPITKSVVQPFRRQKPHIHAVLGTVGKMRATNDRGAARLIRTCKKTALLPQTSGMCALSFQAK